MKFQPHQIFIVETIIFLALAYFLYNFLLPIFGLVQEGDVRAGIAIGIAFVVYFIIGTNILKIIK